MIRTFSIILCVMVMFVSCKTNIVEEQKIELENQQIGLTSVHNARQLGGYQIGNQRIKDNLLLRTAKISELSKEDSTLLCINIRCNASMISAARKKVFRLRMSSQGKPDMCLLLCLFPKERASLIPSLKMKRK